MVLLILALTKYSIYFYPIALKYILKYLCKLKYHLNYICIYLNSKTIVCYKKLNSMYSQAAMYV